METITRCASLEQARNGAIAWLEQRGTVFGPQRKIEIGRLGLLTDYEVGVSATTKPFWRLRLDFDPGKGPHFNAEFGEGPIRKKAAFLFPGTEDLIRRLRNSRKLR